MLTRCPGQNIKIGISLDGIGEEHDRLRGIPGLFKHVVATVQELGNLKRRFPTLRVDIGMTVHGLNYNTVLDTARWVRQNLPVDVLKPILVAAIRSIPRRAMTFARRLILTSLIMTLLA